MMESSTLRGLCIFLSAIILVAFGFLERKTGIPFLSNITYLAIIITVLVILGNIAFFVFNKKLEEENDDNDLPVIKK